jgi:hypothetical protein
MDDGMHDILESVLPSMHEDEIGNNVDFNFNPSEEKTEKYSKLLQRAQGQFLLE